MKERSLGAAMKFGRSWCEARLVRDPQNLNPVREP